jgi:quercetin dioxygenase-like cupin family protein
VVSGGGRIKLDDEVHEIGPLDAVRMAPGVRRGLEAGPDGLEYLAYGAPIGEQSDGEIIQGWWDE